MNTVVKKNEQRMSTPDVCRGIAIFLVVWGHVLQQGLNGVMDVSENVIFKVIYSFHMPLFMVISGFFFFGSQNRKGLKELVFDRVLLLLRILLIWNTICYICKVIVECVQGNKPTLSVRGWIDEILLGYWFLWAVLFFTFIVGLVCKIFSRKRWFWGCLLLAPTMLISPCRWVMLTIYPFYLIGFFYSARKDEEKMSFKKLKYVAIGLFVIGIVLYLSHAAVGNSGLKGLLDICINIVKKEAGLDALMVQGLQVCTYYFLGFTGSITVIVLVDLAAKKASKAKVVKLISEVGKYSLQIYILQRVIVEILSREVYMKVAELTDSISVFTYVYSFVISFVCVAVIFIIAKYGIRGKVKGVLFDR